MNIKKSLLVASFLLLASAQVLAAPARNSRSRNTVEEIKFGPQLGGLTRWQAGVTGEYKFSESLGLQTGLEFVRDWYMLVEPKVSNGKIAFTVLDRINLPIVLRGYPGDDRQFCWFGGFQLGYITEADFAFANDDMSSSSSFGEIGKERKKLEKGSKSNVVKLEDIQEKDQVNRFQFGIVVGFDYEFSFGLTLGLRYSKELIDVLKSKDSVFNWNFRPTLGYNFGKLLE